MYRIRKSFNLEMAHRLRKAYSTACSDCIHGHSYLIELFLTASWLDDTGMVLDFGKVKAFTDEVKAKWDHACFLPEPHKDDADFFLDDVRSNRHYTLIEENATAEWMAENLFRHLHTFIKATENTNRVHVAKVRVHETVSGYAEFWEE